jgi:hypothetical protein
VGWEWVRRVYVKLLSCKAKAGHDFGTGAARIDAVPGHAACSHELLLRGGCEIRGLQTCKERMTHTT